MTPANILAAFRVTVVMADVSRGTFVLRAMYHVVHLSLLREGIFRVTCLSSHNV